MQRGISFMLIMTVLLASAVPMSYANGESVASSIASEATGAASQVASLGDDTPKNPDEAHYVALTFDDGPHKSRTPRLLDILAEYDAKATFFVLGENAAKNPEVLERMVAEGHAIGNHTYTHVNLRKVSSSTRKQEVRDTQELITAAGYTGPQMLRPPYGALNDKVRGWLADSNYPIIFWSWDTLDWKLKNAKKIANVVLEETKGGDIVLLHDIHETTVDGVEIFIKKLAEKGYKFVTVPELIEIYGQDISDKNFWDSAR